MSRIFLVFSVVSLTFAFSSNTSFAQCDASPQSCGCSSEINQCGNGGRLFNSGGGCKGGCSFGQGGLSSIGGAFRGGGSSLGIGSCLGGSGSCLGNGNSCGCGAGPAPVASCGCSGGRSRSNTGVFQGVVGGLLPRVNVSFNQGQNCGCGGNAAPRKGGLCGLFTDITGISASVTRTQTGNCGGNSAAGCGCGSNRYLKLMAGWNFVGGDDEFEGVGTTNDGFLLGFARGRRINNNTRFEFESSWRNNSGNFTGATPLDGRVNVFSPTVNLYRDFGSGSIRPYIGGGIGVAFQDAEFTTGEVDDFAFAYQAAVGLAFNTSPGKDWFVEYRYYGNTDTDLEFGGATIGEVSYDATNLIFGFRQRF